MLSPSRLARRRAQIIDERVPAPPGHEKPIIECLLPDGGFFRALKTYSKGLLFSGHSESEKDFEAAHVDVVAAIMASGLVLSPFVAISKKSRASSGRNGRERQVKREARSVAVVVRK